MYYISQVPWSNINPNSLSVGLGERAHRHSNSDVNRINVSHGEWEKNSWENFGSEGPQ